MKLGPRDIAEDKGRELAKSMVRESFRDLILADPEFRDSIRPVLKSLIREILREERILPPLRPGR
ncbi:MAG TPA: hypothetical protein VKO45_08675 [Methanomicrobiales archaeon]|nr:hypothetical protein [Methanomicrobiales archaeon]